MKTALYRHFDAQDVLLYVGISLSAVHRLEQHRHRSGWFGQIKRVDVEWHPSREAALDAEALAIALEIPLWNKSRPTPRQLLKLPTAVQHLATGRLNGWYADLATSQHMLGWFRAVFPGDQFKLAAPSVGGDNLISRARELKPIDCRLWAVSGPNYAAGDTFDREAA